MNCQVLAAGLSSTSTTAVLLGSNLSVLIVLLAQTCVGGLDGAAPESAVRTYFWVSAFCTAVGAAAFGALMSLGETRQAFADGSPLIARVLLLAPPEDAAAAADPLLAAAAAPNKAPLSVAGTAFLLRHELGILFVQLVALHLFIGTLAYVESYRAPGSVGHRLDTTLYFEACICLAVARGMALVIRTDFESPPRSLYGALAAMLFVCLLFGVYVGAPHLLPRSDVLAVLGTAAISSISGYLGATLYEFGYVAVATTIALFEPMCRTFSHPLAPSSRRPLHLETPLEQRFGGALVNLVYQAGHFVAGLALLGLALTVLP